MIPSGRIRPAQMKRMMKQLGLEELKDVQEVSIRTAKEDLIIRNASVARMNVQGQTVFQVVGEPEVVGKESPEVSEEDVKLVSEKAGVSEEEARKALLECDGEPAEAIVRLMSR